MPVWGDGEGMKPEAAVLRACLDYLAAKHIWAMRCNTGAVKTDNRFFRFGIPGMADVLAIVPMKGGLFMPVWLEMKAEKGRQSLLQKSFEDDVLDRGMKYFLVRSIDDLIFALDSL